MQLSEVFRRLLLRHAQGLAPPARVGRPRLLSDESAVDNIFLVLRSGMQWRELNAERHFSTIFRRMKLWVEKGVIQSAYKETLRTYKRLCPTKYYCVDSSYVKNKFGRTGLGKNHTDRGRKALKLSTVVDQHGIAFGVCSHPANRPDVTLLDETLAASLLTLESVPLYADRGYDSRKNRTICQDYHLGDRIFRRKTKTVRRTNAKRIVVEHTFAWLDSYRRLLLCYEQTPNTYVAFVYLALGHIVSRRFLTPNAISVEVRG